MSWPTGRATLIHLAQWSRECALSYDTRWYVSLVVFISGLFLYNVTCTCITVCIVLGHACACKSCYVKETRFSSRTRLSWVVVVPRSHHYLSSYWPPIARRKPGNLEMESTSNMSYNSTTEQVMSAIDLNDLRGPTNSASHSVLAYLGPAGTYSHQV